MKVFSAILLFAVCAVCFGGEASRKDFSKGGTVLLIGDSIFDSHQGDKRLEAVLKAALERRAPQGKWTVFNDAHGGEYIGPREGEPKGTSGPLFNDDKTGRYFSVVKKRPNVDAVVINYGANDGKVYSPAVFRKRLEFLCAQLGRDYPGVQIILSTGMYLDPKHSTGYWIDQPKVPGFKNGSSRNDYLQGYIKEAQELAREKGYLVADVHHAMKAATEKGDWDFRIRLGNGDPNDDAKHADDPRWFSDIHPNDHGTAFIAQTIAETLLPQR